MSPNAVYLDSYVLQNDLRLRLPKSILNNLPIKKGQTRFAIYFDATQEEIILRIESNLNSNIDYKK